MKPIFVLSCMLSLGAAAPIVSASPDIPFIHRHKTNPATTDPAPKAKTRRNLLHRAAPSREEVARSEATFGMPGPRSVGYFHPQPGPAGVGAK
jgi:hypothetical protein